MLTRSRYACFCRLTKGWVGPCQHVPCLYFDLALDELALLTDKNQKITKSLQAKLALFDPHLWWISRFQPPANAQEDYVFFVFDVVRDVPTAIGLNYSKVGNALCDELMKMADAFCLTTGRKVAVLPFVSCVHSPQEAKDKQGKTIVRGTFRVAVQVSKEFSSTLLDLLDSAEDLRSSLRLVYHPRKIVSKVPLLEPLPPPPGKCTIEFMSGERVVREDTPRPEFARPAFAESRRDLPEIKEEAIKSDEELMPPPAIGHTIDPDFGPSEVLTKMSLAENAEDVRTGEEELEEELEDGELEEGELEAGELEEEEGVTVEV